MTQFASPFTKLVVGLGQETEDGNPVPVIFRKNVANPLSGSGTPQPQAGRATHTTGSPFVGNNPLPL